MELLTSTHDFFVGVPLEQSRGVLPDMGYIGMCGPKGYDFSAV